MKRRELEQALLTLETTPVLLERLTEAPPGAGRPDLRSPRILRVFRDMALREEALWGRWIRHLLADPTPLLPELEWHAAEDAPELELTDAAARFHEARDRNLRLLREAPGAAWNRAGILEKGGILYLREIPAAMAEGDRRELAMIARGGTAAGPTALPRPPADLLDATVVPLPEELASRR